MTQAYYYRKEPCPCCGQGPLMFLSCKACETTLGWCAERDHAVGVYRERDLLDIGLGASKQWASEGCPSCGSAELGYSSSEDIEKLGFTLEEVMFSPIGEP